MTASMILIIMLFVFTVEEKDILRIYVIGRKRGRLYRPRYSKQRTTRAMMIMIWIMEIDTLDLLL
jgi:hypothetical protein